MQFAAPGRGDRGGLTAIDTATESLAYYVVQIEKCPRAYECSRKRSAKTRSAPLGRPGARDRRGIPRARARDPRERNEATREFRCTRIAEMLQRWGGVTIAYRRRLIDSPSYTLNHEEVEKALEEGIVFAKA